jgi:hypothetical protein
VTEAMEAGEIASTAHPWHVERHAAKVECAQISGADSGADLEKLRGRIL